MSRLIDADALKSAIRKKFPNLWDRIEINGLINEQPTIKPEDVRRGKWISTRPDAPMFGYYYCSLCGRHKTSPQDKYCPQCGAKMEEEDG